MYKKIISILVAVAAVFSMAAAAFGAEDVSFPDVAEDAYYADAVDWAVTNGITVGMGNGLFMPEDTCTRAQVVTFLWRHAGEPATAAKNTFTDVKSDAWYADAVLWAVKEEVTDGMGKGIFLPEGVCTRAQIVSFLWKYAGRPAVASATGNPFADVDPDAWYTDAILWAMEEGITTGVTQTSFAPDEPCTRAQIVTFLYRYDGGEVEEPEVTEPTETVPSETEPTETVPAETEPTEMVPSETEPTETNPPETEDKDEVPDRDNETGIY